MKALVTSICMGGSLCKDAGPGASASLGIWSAASGNWITGMHGIRFGGRIGIGLLTYGSGLGKDWRLEDNGLQCR